MKLNEIYLMYVKDLNAYKIGVSKNSKKRLKQLQTGCPYNIEIKHIFFSKFAYKVESILHREFNTYKIDIDEKKLNGEWFILTSDQVSNFINRCQLIESNIDFLKKSGNVFMH